MVRTRGGGGGGGWGGLHTRTGPGCPPVGTPRLQISKSLVQISFLIVTVGQSFQHKNQVLGATTRKLVAGPASGKPIVS